MANTIFFIVFNGKTIVQSAIKLLRKIRDAANKAQSEVLAGKQGHKTLDPRFHFSTTTLAYTVTQHVPDYRAAICQ